MSIKIRRLAVLPLITFLKKEHMGLKKSLPGFNFPSKEDLPPDHWEENTTEQLIMHLTPVTTRLSGCDSG